LISHRVNTDVRNAGGTFRRFINEAAVTSTYIEMELRSAAANCGEFVGRHFTDRFSDYNAHASL
jgi:hypothetical protein